jgi:outer membrane protein
MRRLALTAILAISAVPLHAEETTPKAQDLLSVYRQALTQDATWAAAQASHQAALEAIPQARALFLPQLNASANTTWNNYDIQYRAPTALPGGNRAWNSNGYSVSLTQPIFRPQNGALYLEAKAQVRQADAQLISARQDLILRVAQAYFDVLLAQDNVNLAGAQKAAIAQQLEQAKRGFEVGTLTITDTHEAQARYDLAVSQEIAAGNNLEVAKQALARIVGEQPAPLVPLKSQLSLSPPTPNDINQWVNAAKQQNLQVEIQRQALEIAKDEVTRNRSAHLPIIDVVGSYGSSHAGNGTFGIGANIDSTIIGLQLQVPIYQGGAIQSRVRQALAGRDQAQQNLEAAQRQAVLLANQSFLGVTSGLAQVQALEQALASSRTSLNSSKLGLEVGVRTNIDVLNAQQQLYNAERDLFAARYNYLLSELRLKSAVSTLSEQDVIQVNELLGGKAGTSIEQGQTTPAQPGQPVAPPTIVPPSTPATPAPPAAAPAPAAPTPTPSPTVPPQAPPAAPSP